MFDLNQIVDGLLRLFVLMLPVMGVLLLLAAVHLVGGAVRSRTRQAKSGGVSQPSPLTVTRIRSPLRSDRSDSSKVGAA